MEIDESKTAVVRRIFDIYVKQDLTVRQIAKQLTLGGTPAPSGGPPMELGHGRPHSSG
jgi:hypothetical protein